MRVAPFKMEGGWPAIEMVFPSFRNLFLQYFLNLLLENTEPENKTSLRITQNVLYFLGLSHKKIPIETTQKINHTGPVRELNSGPLAP